MVQISWNLVPTFAFAAPACNECTGLVVAGTFDSGTQDWQSVDLVC